MTNDTRKLTDKEKAVLEPIAENFGKAIADLFGVALAFGVPFRKLVTELTDKIIGKIEESPEYRLLEMIASLGDTGSV